MEIKLRHNTAPQGNTTHQDRAQILQKLRVLHSKAVLNQIELDEEKEFLLFKVGIDEIAEANRLGIPLEQNDIHTTPKQFQLISEFQSLLDELEALPVDSKLADAKGGI